MEPIEEYTHSFIIKIWREHSGHHVTWRGHITHVPDGARRSLNQLKEIVVFIEPYLLHKSLPSGWKDQLRRLLMQRK